MPSSDMLCRFSFFNSFPALRTINRNYRCNLCDAVSVMCCCNDIDNSFTPSTALLLLLALAFLLLDLLVDLINSCFSSLVVDDVVVVVFEVDDLSFSAPFNVAGSK